MRSKICMDCFKDVFLKRYVNKNGILGVCSKCGTKSSKVISVNSKDFQNRFKASIRYHYSEILYNSHWGGYSNWIYLLIKKNKIFKSPIDEENESLYWEIDNIPGYVKEYSRDVSLYYGGGRLDAFIWPITLEQWEFILELSSDIMYNNPDVITKLIVEKIKKLVKPLEMEIVDICLYRARIGLKSTLSYAEIGDESVDVYVPYRKGEIGAPWPRFASEGRFNRKGTAYLYLASTKETAINEVRPSVGHYISVGQFKIKNKIKILDFTNLDFYDYAISDDKIEEYVKMKGIDNILSIPSPDKEYRLTQGFADAFISLGYDGVKFASSVSDKTYNIVLFDRRNADHIEGAEEAVYIKKMKYDYENMNTKLDRDRVTDYIDVNNPGNEDKIILESFGIDVRKEFL